MISGIINIIVILSLILYVLYVAAEFTNRMK